MDDEVRTALYEFFVTRECPNSGALDERGHLVAWRNPELAFVWEGARTVALAAVFFLGVRGAF